MINSYSVLIDEATKALCDFGYHLPGLPPSEQPFDMSELFPHYLALISTRHIANFQLNAL
jgi:hypothetical protein